MTAIRLGELAVEVGFPPGVVNVLTGRGEMTGAALVGHAGVDKVSFTGSTEVGKAIVAASAGDLKRVSLELGGKSPSVVFADADLEAAAEQSAWGVFYNSGQDCTAVCALVEASVFDEVVERVADRARAITVGPAFAADAEIGPLITGEHRERVEGYIAVGAGEGATVVAGGGRPSGLGAGYFLEPTVLAGGGASGRVVREDIWACRRRAAVRRRGGGCRSRERLAVRPRGGGRTRDASRAHRLSAALRAGTVWVNQYGAVDAAAPFGGFKESGHGREHGQAALLDLYLETKTVWVGLD